MGLTQVSTDGVKNDAITKTKIPANQIEASELADNAVDTNAIANNAVTAGKLASGVTDLSNDTSPQLGGTLDSNGNNIDFAEVDKLRFGTDQDLRIWHQTNSNILGSSGVMYLHNTGASATDLDIRAQNDILLKPQNGEQGIKIIGDGAVELYQDNVLRFQTSSNGFDLKHSTGDVNLHFNRYIVNAGQTYFFDHTATGADFKFRTSDSSGLDTEAIQIFSTGSLYNKSRSSSHTSLTLRKQITGADGIDYFQCRNSANTLKLQIQGTGAVRNSTNFYGQISDIKLKENIVDANSQWNDIKSIRVRNWNFKESTGLPTHKQIGVVAQELETVSAGLVDEQIDRDNDTGEDLGTTTKGVKYSILYMKAVKCLQEAMARIEALETEVAALKGL